MRIVQGSENVSGLSISASYMMWSRLIIVYRSVTVVPNPVKLPARSSHVSAEHPVHTHDERVAVPLTE